MQNRRESVSSTCDIAIGGAGIAGLTLALAVKSALGQAVDVRIFDPRLNQTVTEDTGRASALAAGPRRMMEALHVWPLLSDVQPILQMVCTDSRLDDPVRPVFLQFDAPQGDEPFASMIRNDELRDALLARCREEGVILVAQKLRQFTAKTDFIEIETESGVISARLLIAADGAASRLREFARIPVTRHSYDQTGIVATIALERPHEGRAEEHFLPDGPFAILPLTGNRASIVWSDRRAHARALLALDDEDFMAELERRFTLRFGALKLVERPKAFPLNLQWARSFVAPRLALIGDAAHVIHPIAGQGLNLGLKDVACLAELIVGRMRLGLDPGSADILAAYQQARRFDAVRMGTTCDLIYRLFSNDVLPVRLIRDLGLGLVNKMPRLKRAFISQAAGLTGDVPLLLRGEPL